MTPRKLTLVIVIVALLVVSYLLVQSQNARMCKIGKVRSSFDLPSEPQMARFQTTRVDENCNLIVGPVQTVPIDELPPGVFDPNIIRDELPPLTRDKTGGK